MADMDNKENCNALRAVDSILNRLTDSSTLVYYLNIHDIKITRW